MSDLWLDIELVFMNRAIVGLTRYYLILHNETLSVIAMVENITVEFER